MVEGGIFSRTILKMKTIDSDIDLLSGKLGSQGEIGRSLTAPFCQLFM